jgi:predicted PurR-regulated permease PerM
MEIKLPFYARLTFVLLCIVLVYAMLAVGRGVFVPLVFSGLTAIFLHPVVQFLRRKTRMSEGAAIAISVFGFLAMLGGLLYLLSFQMVAFSQDFPVLQQKVTHWATQLQAWAAKKYRINTADQADYLSTVSAGFLSGAASTVAALFVGIVAFLFWTVLVFIYTFFILLHRRLLVRFVVALFPMKFRRDVKHSILETQVVTNGYVQGLIIELLIVATVSCVGLSILGIKYALLLGLLTAVLNLLPYLGFLVAISLTALVTLVHHSPATAITACAILFVLHLLDANVLAPRIIGHRVRMNPFATLVAILIGGAVWGIAGLFLAIPLSALVKIVFSHVYSLQPWAMVMGKEEDAPPEGELENEPTPVSPPDGTVAA